MPGLEPFGHEVADGGWGDAAVANLVPDLARGLGGVAGAVGAVELLQRIPGEIDEGDLERHGGGIYSSAPPAARAGGGESC